MTLNKSEFPVKSFPDKAEYRSVEVRKYSATLKRESLRSYESQTGATR